MLKELFGSLFGGQASTVRVATVDETNVAVKNDGVQFIDVRTDAEYRGGHAKRAKHFPLDKLPSLLDKLDKEKPVYVICQSGMRSMRAATLMESSGFKEVYNVTGGTSAWVSQRYETER